jgi:hypothetical protein
MVPKMNQKVCGTKKIQTMMDTFPGTNLEDPKVHSHHAENFKCVTMKMYLGMPNKSVI